jgi:mRNA-degrading endonuclease HigB of HigAB toxin-antitoxin module
MKARSSDYDSRRKRQRTAKKQGSFTSKDQTIRKGPMQRRMKSEERTTSIYLNPSQKKKSSKIYNEKSVSNRMNFKNEFEDYVQASTSRKQKNQQKKGKLESTLPFVGKYKVNNQVYSMINSLNNSGFLLGDQSTSVDKNSISVHHKPSNSVSSNIPVKGKGFSGMNTSMVNYAKDIDYLMMVEGSTGLKLNNDSVHNYSVNTNGKVNKKKTLIVTNQKNNKRRSVERENIKSKQKRSASDGNRLFSSKGRKKDELKSPPSHSAYYTKMIASFNNTGKFPAKSLRKMMSKTNKYSNPASNLLSKKNSKEFNSKKKIKSYYDPHNNSKTKDERHKSNNIRSVPLSLMNSFEKNMQDKFIKNTSLMNNQKFPNQIFYQKGKVNVSGQHLKFSKPKSKSNMSNHSEHPTHYFGKSLAFSGDSTPISPFHQNSKNFKKAGKPTQMIPSPFPKSSTSGITYDHMGYPSYYPKVYHRPETNVNMYDEDISVLSSNNNSKHHSFYQDISGSFASQTYDNPISKSKHQNYQGYTYEENKKLIMDRKTKMSKISELMGSKDVSKKMGKKNKNKSSFQRKS